MNIVIVCNVYICVRHEDLKQMLDSSKDNLKLEAMKRIIGVSNTACILCTVKVVCADCDTEEY